MIRDRAGSVLIKAIEKKLHDYSTIELFAMRLWKSMSSTSAWGHCCIWEFVRVQQEIILDIFVRVNSKGCDRKSLYKPDSRNDPVWTRNCGHCSFTQQSGACLEAILQSSPTSSMNRRQDLGWSWWGDKLRLSKLEDLNGWAVEDRSRFQVLAVKIVSYYLEPCFSSSLRFVPVQYCTVQYNIDWLIDWFYTLGD